MPTLTPPAPAVDSQSIVRDAIKKVTTLATLPEVTTRIIATVEDPKSSAAHLHKIVSHDPALVTRILKVVNSAFYGLPGQVASIERAIVLLGLNAVKNIAVAASLGQLFRGVKLCDGFTARDLWTHCIAVGLTARELSKAAKLSIGDEAFLAGMIHDVGIVVELQTWPEKIRTICQNVLKQGGNFSQAERELLGLDHQVLGKALAEQWKFPKACQQVAGFHHNPMESEEEYRQLVTVVHVADILCCQTGQGFTLTALDTPMDENAIGAAGLKQADIEAIRVALPEFVKNTMAIFS